MITCYGCCFPIIYALFNINESFMAFSLSIFHLPSMDFPINKDDTFGV